MFRVLNSSQLARLTTCLTGTAVISQYQLLSSEQPCSQSLRRISTNSSEKVAHPCSKANKFVAGCPELKIFTGNANPVLAGMVADELHTSVGLAKVHSFADGEISVKVLESCRGKDVYIIQPTAPPVNENLMELLLLISALRRSSAKKVSVVLPYFGYMRSAVTDIKRKYEDEDAGDAISFRSNLAASDVARMIEVAGAQRVVALDLSAYGQGMPEGFFQNIPIESIHSSNFVADNLIEELDLKELKDDGLVVVSSHAACISNAKLIREELKSKLNVSIGLATIIRDPATGGADLVGDCGNKKVLIIEDIVDSGKTTLNAVRSCKAHGATTVYCFGSHPIMGSKCADRLQEAGIEKMIVLNTVNIPQSTIDACPNLVVVSVAPVIAELIAKMHYEPK